MSENKDSRWGDENIFDQANQLSILEVIQYFLPQTDLSSKKIICPFPSHKGGAELSASFHIHPAKNQFYCFGCKLGGRPIDFVVGMTGSSRLEAAVQLTTKSFSSVLVKSFQEDQKQRLETLMTFSTKIKAFRESYPEHYQVAEDLCEVFDALCSKHNLSNSALAETVSQLLSTLDSYESTYSW